MILKIRQLIRIERLDGVLHAYFYPVEVQLTLSEPVDGGTAAHPCTVFNDGAGIYNYYVVD